MKKTYIFIATVIICCLFLWIGFYAGWSSKTVTTPTEEKKDCMSLYPVVKEYIIDKYQSEPIEWVDLSYSNVRDVEVWHNSEDNGCYATANVTYADYTYTDTEPHYRVTKTQMLFSVWDEIKVIYRCDFNPELKDCRNDFDIMVWNYKKSS